MSEQVDPLDPELRLRLADDAVWAEPPAGLEDSIVSAIAAEAAASPVDVIDLTTEPSDSGHTSPASTDPVVTPIDRARRSRPRWLPAVAAAAAVLLVAIAAVGLLTRSNGEARPELALAGTALAPAASADATFQDTPQGVRIRVDLKKVPPAPEGSYYQGWLRSKTEGPITIGTFHARGGDGRIELWSAVPIDRYPIMTITLQKEGTGPESSGKVILSGTFKP